MLMKIDFSICTPVYNRAHLLPRLYQSLIDNLSGSVCFEWLLVDDGSSDNITPFVKSVYDEGLVPFTYIKKQNEGKHSCLNLFFEQAKGELLLILDSDDLLATNSLFKVKSLWTNIEDKQRCAGIIGLCALIDDKLLSDPFPASPMYSTLLANAYELCLAGDRCDFIRTDLLREKRFPIIQHEKFMPEAVVMLDFDIDYKYYCVNEVLKIVEYQEAGLSNNFTKLAMKNPKGMILRFERILNEKRLLKQINFFSKIKMYGNHSRYVLHSSAKYFQQVHSIKKYYFLPFIIGMISGILLYLRDKILIRQS